MTEIEPSPKNTADSGPLSRPILVGLLGASLATAASYFSPTSHASTLVGLIFLGLTAFLCQRSDKNLTEFGLGFGGVFDRVPLSARHITAETARALLIALSVSAIVFPLFTIGYVFWFEPRHPFSLTRALGFGGPSELFPVLDLTLAHLIVVALPEEAFFRGYLQTTLARALPSDGFIRALLPNLIASAIFALGHYATDPTPSRLAVFFPSLLFGLIRQRTGGVGASIFFHTLSNLYSAFLAAGFGFGR